LIWSAGAAEKTYRAARDRLEQTAASLDPEAILAYARFLLSWELAHEALA
jgi:hypothetical protein